MTATTSPQVHGPADVIENLRRALITEAAAAHAQFPQYAGHWDTWRVAEVTRPVRTKMGQAFHAGELALVDPETFSEFATAYSRSNRIDTAVRAAYVREVRAD